MTHLIFWPLVSGAIANSSPLTHDPFFSSVVQLAHFDGTNGSTTFTNSCPRGNTMTNVNSCTLSTTSPKWGTASLNNAGNTNCGARGTSTADYNFGTSDWTVEFWTNPTTLNDDFNSAKVYFDMRNSSLTAAWVPTFADGGTANGTMKLILNGSARITSAANAIVAGSWQHVAASRNSGTTRLFIGGIQVGSDFADTNTYVQNQMTLGAAGNGAGGCIGKFDDLRVTNGVGRYTTNFTVPSGPFPNQ